MTKLTGETLNIEEENIQKIKELFPEVDTDGKIDFDKLKQLLGNYVEDSDERYNFTWNGKGEALRISQTPSMGTLRPAPEESKNWDETENLYIEGDNLEVLKLLQKSYFNKIKMIYIDPPYNTGGDFVYKDNFKDNIKNYKELTGQIDSEGQHTTTNREYSGRYHTDWLNMMYPRLRIANNLLSEDGIIFISIDDNEQSNLKKLCDEIFDVENFIGQIIVNKASQIATEYTVDMHEYVLIYAKSKSKFMLGDNFKYTISRGTVGNEDQTTPIIEFPAGLRCYGLDDGVYKETRKIEGSRENIKNYDDIVIKNGKLAETVRLQARWRSSNDMRNFFNNNCEPTKAKINGELVEIYFENNRFNPQIKKRVREKYKTLYTKNKRGSTELDKLGVNYFDHPKYSQMIKDLIKRASSSDSLILDFFAGSSTTAHAVMDLNVEDNGNRKFIMVQLPEETDKKSEAYKAGYENVSEIGKERIRRAGDQIKDELTEKYEAASEEEQKEIKNPDELDIGFKTFKLDSSNIKEWNPGQYDDVQLAIEDSLTPYVEGRTEKDVLYELMLKMGLELTTSIKEYSIDNKMIYSIGMGYLMICLADNINSDVANKMMKIKDIENPEEFTVIFKDSGFRNDTDKTNIKETLRSAGLAEEAFITL